MVEFGYSSCFFQQSAKIKEDKSYKTSPQISPGFKKIAIFQWVPSHAGLEGNETAEKLAKKGTLHTAETPTQADAFGGGAS